jgi:thiamine biosynthesis protein ThiI
METVTRVLATTGEISLKSGNRRWFERKLNANIRHALADLPLAAIDRPSWRVLMSFAEPVPFLDAARRLGTVFGLHSVMPVQHLGHTMDEVRAGVAPLLDELEATSFAVRCIRSDKGFPLTSMAIEREIGAFVQERTGWSVDLSAPDLIVHLLVDVNGFWLWHRALAGPGGLPVGVGGRGLCLLSGGIDSPVAAYLMMKRGMRLDFVHFHSMPRTDPASVEKATDLVRVLCRYQGPGRLARVPLLPIQEEVVARCAPELRVLLYRRFMIRIAEAMGRRFRASVLVTGESLGQVASQTVENLAAIQAATTMPILRPLIGLDKQEIIAVARRAGTYELSIRPHADSCSFLLPEHPATRSSAGELAAEEAAVDVDALVRPAVKATSIDRCTDLAPWQAIPAPPPCGQGGTLR